MLLYNIEEVANLFIDAAVADDNNHLLFLSVWGLDTAIQEFLAKLSIPNHEGGLKNFQVRYQDHIHKYRVLDANCLDKITGRTTKDTCFDKLIHVLLHDRLTYQIDYANRRCILLKRHGDDTEKFSQQLWQAVQTVCPVPLLPEWEHIIGEFIALGWIKKYEGIAVDAYQLDFSSEDVEKQISHLIKIGLLALPKKVRHLSLIH